MTRKILGEGMFEFERLISAYADSYIQNDEVSKSRLIKEIQDHLSTCSSVEISKRYHRLVGTLIPGNHLNNTAKMAVASLFKPSQDLDARNECELDIECNKNQL